MMGRRRSGGLLNAILILIVLGLILAVLRVYNHNPLDVVNWIANKLWLIVDSIASWFQQNKTFQEITQH